MADPRTLSDVSEDLRAAWESAERKARRRIGLTLALTVFAAGYMTWMYGGVSQLDADAVTDIARAEVERQLPTVGDRIAEIAIDAAPGLLDHGEQAVLSAPSALRDTVEERLCERVDPVIEEMAHRLDTQLAEAIESQLELATQTGENGEPVPSLESAMDALRAEYRDRSEALLTELYLAYAREISAVDEFLARLRTADDLNPREQVQREIIEASVALRRHYVEPIEPVSAIEDDE